MRHQPLRQCGEFDAVVAFGGSLSYAFEPTDEAMRGLLRVIQPNGLVVASVMSLLGTWRHFLSAITTLSEVVGEGANHEALRSGDLRDVVSDVGAHICRMFRWSDLEALVKRTGARIVDGSASNWASLGDTEVLARLEADPARWERFLEHEIAACAEPGARDGATHMPPRGVSGSASTDRAPETGERSSAVALPLHDGRRSVRGGRLDAPESRAPTRSEPCTRSASEQSAL